MQNKDVPETHGSDNGVLGQPKDDVENARLNEQHVVEAVSVECSALGPIPYVGSICVIMLSESAPYKNRSDGYSLKSKIRICLIITTGLNQVNRDRVVHLSGDSKTVARRGPRVPGIAEMISTSDSPNSGL